MGYRAGRHLSFAREAGAKYAEPTASSTGHWHLPPSVARISTSDGRLALFLKLSTPHHDTPNGFTKDLDAAPAVHVVYTESDAAKFGGFGVAAERNIVVKLLKDVPRFGRAGTMHLLQKFDMCPLQVP